MVGLVCKRQIQATMQRSFLFKTFILFAGLLTCVGYYLIWIRKAVDSQPLQGKIIGNYKSFKIRSWDSKQVYRLEPPLYSSQRQPSIYLYSSSRLTPHLWLLSDAWPLNSPDTWRTNFSWEPIRAMQHFQWGKKTHLEFNQISHLPEVVFSCRATL